ncbi:MAG: flagellar protein FliT [Firmicutes bacterium]|nr:flagellar protein FliT [Bacillota bacterium]
MQEGKGVRPEGEGVMKERLVVWEKALALAHQLAEATRLLEEQLAAGQIEALDGLLDARQRVMFELDQLRAENGIPSWVAEAGTEEKVSTEVQEIRQKIQGIFEQVTSRDEGIRREMQSKLAECRDNLANLRRLKKASQAYRAGPVLPEGIFVDSKR